jgi:hypothetical protein
LLTPEDIPVDAVGNEQEVMLQVLGNVQNRLLKEVAIMNSGRIHLLEAKVREKETQIENLNRCIAKNTDKFGDLCDDLRAAAKG